MPIVHCQHSPIVVDPNTNIPTFVNPADRLVNLGPTIEVEIGYDANMFGNNPQEAVQALLSQKAPQNALVPALIDTGASDNCIDDALAVKLQLPVIDRVQCSGSAGSHTVNVYLGHIKIAALGHIAYGQFIGVNLSGGGQPQQALLGRSLFKDMIMVYDGKLGTMVLSK